MRLPHQARGHVGAATLRRGLERMDAVWPEGEEHMAKLSVNAMIGLWARLLQGLPKSRQESLGWRSVSHCWGAAHRRAWRRRGQRCGGGARWRTPWSTARPATPCCSRGS